MLTKDSAGRTYFAGDNISFTVRDLARLGITVQPETVRRIREFDNASLMHPAVVERTSMPLLGQIQSEVKR
jgi:hypothetical protein